MLKMGLRGGSTWKVNLTTGHMMSLLEGQDWALCDKDRGWCRYYYESIQY